MSTAARFTWILMLSGALAACGSGSGTAPSPDGSAGTSGAGGASGGSGGTGAAAGTGGSAGSGCPPNCFAPNECVSNCGETPTNYGCCPCPSGTINVYDCPADAGSDAPNCGLVGSPCPGATTCGSGLACAAGVCAPASSSCAAPPGGVGCGSGQACLQYAGQQDGLCVTPSERSCLCAGASSSFECD